MEQTHAARMMVALEMRHRLPPQMICPLREVECMKCMIALHGWHRRANELTYAIIMKLSIRSFCLVELV